MHPADLSHSSEKLEKKLQSLYDLNRDKKIDLSFRPPYLDLLKAFGNPHHKLPPVIHVAGTNGKGSIVAMLRSIFDQDGLKTHSYTSPHLWHFNERIVLSGKQIDDAFLEDLIDEALALNKKNDVTFFEITTAMAFAAFSRVPADICLLEVGLGGRLDCTNIVEKPACCVINTIGLDHQEWLGHTLADIAAEKAGIMKPGVPCVIGPQPNQDVFKVFETMAVEKDVPLYRHGYEWDITQSGDVMLFTWQGYTEEYNVPNLIGPHQILNAGAALAVLSLSGHDINAHDINVGLQSVDWPGRLQQIQTGDNEFWYDGGHNVDAAHMLSAQIQKWQSADPKPLHLIIGMKKDKDTKGFTEILLQSADTISIVPLSGIGECLHAADIDMNANDFPSVQAAIQQISDNHHPGPKRILVCGSLYLAQQVLPKRP